MNTCLKSIIGALRVIRIQAQTKCASIHQFVDVSLVPPSGEKWGIQHLKNQTTNFAPS